MTQSIILIISIGVLACSALASANDAILGTWLNEPGDGLIRIEADDERYIGLIAGAPPGVDREPGATDLNNPDPALRDRPLLGLQIMGNYRFDGERYVEGWIYDPDNGKRYDSHLTLLPDGRLKVRGFIGVSLFGRSQIWTRHVP